MQEHPAVLGSPNNNCQNIIQKINFIINDKKAGIVISRFHFFSFFADHDAKIMAAQAPMIVFIFFHFLTFASLLFSLSYQVFTILLNSISWFSSNYFYMHLLSIFFYFFLSLDNFYFFLSLDNFYFFLSLDKLWLSIALILTFKHLLRISKS